VTLRSEQIKRVILEELTRQRAALDGEVWPESVSLIVRLDEESGDPYRVQYRTEASRRVGRTGRHRDGS
jgi:hypothetical protein